MGSDREPQLPRNPDRDDELARRQRFQSIVQGGDYIKKVPVYGVPYKYRNQRKRQIKSVCRDESYPVTFRYH